ncbi:MAG: SPASM domain-containing protein [Vicinamibacterales bacterium]
MSEHRPSKIRLEVSSHCQLRCPSCPTTSGAIHPAVGSGLLKAADFRRIIDENPWVRDIELSNYGEILLNPELPAMLEYAHAHGVALRADNGVNLNRATPALLEALVKYRLRSMTCSVDGATQDTYAQYRVRGNVDRVLEHIRTINRFKQQYASPFPVLTWQYVAFGHNEHEIPAARALADELGMIFHVKLSWDPDRSPVTDAETVMAATGAASREDYRQRHGEDYVQFICHQLWEEPQINWDGKVLGCCRNFWGDFGPENAFRDGLLAAVNSEKIRYARDMLRGRRPERDDIPCTTCEIYRGLKADGRRLERTDPPLSRRAWRFIGRATGLADLRHRLRRRLAS